MDESIVTRSLGLSIFWKKIGYTQVMYVGTGILDAFLPNFGRNAAWRQTKRPLVLHLVPTFPLSII